MDLRTLDALRWMNCTGLLEKGRKIIQDHYPSIAKELAPEWKQQDEALSHDPFATRALPVPQHRLMEECTRKSEEMIKRDSAERVAALFEPRQQSALR